MKCRQLLPYLHCFWWLTKSKNFSKAAKELHISSSAISHKIRALEDKLNVKLLKSGSGQRTELTATGHHIAQQCQSIFEDMDVMFKEVINESVSNELVITAPVSFGTYLLIPAAQYANEKLVNADLKFNLTDTVLDVYDKNIDVAIRNVPSSGNLESEELMKVKHVAVASENYINKSPPISEIYHLQNHQLIYSGKNDQDWMRVRKMFPQSGLSHNRNITYINSNISILEGVRNSVGIALLPDYMLKEINLKEMKIRPVLESYFNDNNVGLMDTLYVTYPKVNLKSALINDFIYALRKFLKQQGYLICEESMVA